MGYGRIDYGNWLAGNLVDSACRWGVPLFAMLSGALLLGSDKTEKPSLFFVKRARRILIPMVFWSSFFYVWYAAGSGKSMGAGDAIRRIVLGSHLYYLYIVAFIYFVTPGLRLWVGGARLKGAAVPFFFLGAGFLNSLVYYFSGSTEDALAGRLPIHFFFFAVGFIGYFVGGHYLMSQEMPVRRMYRLSPAAAVASFLVIAAGTSSLVRLYGPGRVGLYLYDYFSPPVILMSFALFICFKRAAGLRATDGTGTTGSAVRALSEASFGVYLVHPFIQDIAGRGMDIVRIGEGAVSVSPWFGIPALAVTVFCISAAATVLIRKVVCLRAVVGG
jgi:surface polysaccharide O-acyltransferase-like enzyme